ncbi:hypothetical protein NM208_g3835 [Fusarium decemcellulare]|uniref:Uncharacterized protein n=1 Tax=Fusarium decemcellulare TaxID=57161 RepID=A0ACC1SMM5_9HYPO|nr:hypothetical protein NM208_g3835 [Fusarium decemcellulare]
MPSSSGLAAPLIISLLTVQGLAQALDKTIVGCDEVQCPVENGEPHCKVRNDTFTNIGLTRIPDVPESLNDFSIVKGINISGPNDDTYINIYYLGTPQNASLDDLYGCVAKFDPPAKKFPENGNGTCSDVIEPACIDALQELAAKVSHTYFEGVCEILQEELENSDIEACQNMTGPGMGIEPRGIHTVKLSNLTNIEGKANSTSDCWPILPKSANLAPIFWDSVGWDGGPSPQTGYDELHGIAPLLTVFMKKANTKSIVNETVSRMSCIKINSTWTVLFKLKPNVPQQTIDEMRDAGKAMVGVVPGLRSFEFGPPLASTAHRAQGFDLGLIAILNTEADVLAYGPHPAHQAVNKIREEIAAETLAYDLEVPDAA